MIETARLRLRELTLDDAPFIYDLLNSPSWIAHIGDRGIRTLDHARAYLESGPIRSYGLHGYGLWMMELLADDVPIGICGLVRRAGLDCPDLGFAVLPAYEGFGYVYEAGVATLAHAHTQLHQKEIAAITTEDNQRSVALLQRLGMRLEGNIRLPGIQEEMLLFRWQPAAPSADPA